MEITPKTATTDKVYFSVEVLEYYDGRHLGVPKPDADGYYDLPICALNARSRNECYYDTKSIYDQITMPQSPFNMMITQGHLYGENGHPDKDAPLERIELITEANKSHHIRKVYCGEECNDGTIPVYALIKPVPPMGYILEASLQNKWENTAFSLRTLMKYTWDAVRKAQYRTVLRLVTFDYVNTPGILQASKRYSPGLETLEAFTNYHKPLVERELTIDDFYDQHGNRAVGFECFSAEDLRKMFGLKEFSIRKMHGQYLKGTLTYINQHNEKRSLIHDLLKQ